MEWAELLFCRVYPVVLTSTGYRSDAIKFDTEHSRRKYSNNIVIYAGLDNQNKVLAYYRFREVYG